MKLRTTVTTALVSLSLCFACTPESAFVDYDIDKDDIADPVPVPDPSEKEHPRLLLLKGQEVDLMRNVNADSRWTKLHSAIIDECATLLTTENQVYKKDSRGTMHSQCCETVRRVLFLTYAYRTTSDSRYLEKVKSVILNFCDLPSWNPYHFLDIAELTIAASFAYDWLYDVLDEQTRQTIMTCIRDKALIPSETGGEGDKDYNLRWMDMTSNWSQVCHGSLAVGAIAIHDKAPELADRIIARSKMKMFIPMQAEYPPMGAYSQGIGYWGYGTALNAIFIDAMQVYAGAESVAAHKEVQGFLQTGRYYAELLTNTLNTFAFSDNSTDLVLPEQCIFWFYKETLDPQLLYYQSRLVDKFTNPSTDYKNGKPYSSSLVTGSYARHLPLMMVWGAGTGGSPTADMDKCEHPTDLFFISEGLNPICTMRTGFDTNDTWVGFKAGNPSCAHGHMDVGEFMFEYGGARFGVDLGSDNYSKVSALGLGSLFDMGANAMRWNKLTRYNNFSHSTLTINGQFQNLDRKSDFISHSDAADRMFAVADLTPAYSGQLASAKRAVALVDKSYIVVEDLLTATSGKDAEVVWNLTTKASAGFSFDAANNIVTLKCKNGSSQTKTVNMKVVFDNPEASPDPITVTRTAVSDEFKYPEAESAAANHYFVRISYKIKKGMTQRMKVYILPSDVDKTTTTSNFID